MPYIDKRNRAILDSHERVPQNAGELNYCITRQLIAYLEHHGKTYQYYNDVVGVLECAKLELSRRSLSAYENVKIEDNGDVYPQSFVNFVKNPTKTIKEK